MKAILVITLCVMLALFVHGAIGQTAGGFVILNAQTSLAGCAWPTSFATVTNGVAVCPLNLAGQPGLAIAVNGGAFSQIPMSQASGGVASFNSRTGNVLPAPGDYSYGQISSPPTTLSCTNASLSTGTSGTLTASGCVIK